MQPAPPFIPVTFLLHSCHIPVTFQLHFLSGSAGIAEGAINALPNLGPGPMRIAQRMRLEPNQIEGVQKRMQVGCLFY